MGSRQLCAGLLLLMLLLLSVHLIAISGMSGKPIDFINLRQAIGGRRVVMMAGHLLRSLARNMLPNRR